MGRIAWTAAFLAALSLSGCASSVARERGWVGNPRALASTIEAPATGNADARSYLAPGLEGRDFGPVRLLKVTVRSTREGSPEMDAMGKRVALSVAEGLYRAVEGSERFARIVGEEEKADYLLGAEALVHLALVNGRVTPDPVTNDPASKLFVVYTLTEAATGKVAAKYTAVGVSQWEHTPSAKADLESKGVVLGQEFFLFLTGI